MATFHGRNSILAIIKSGESTYTEVAQIEDYSGFGWTRAVVTADGYKSIAIGKKFDPAIDLKAGTLRLRFDPTETTHDEETGIIKLSLTNVVTSIEMRGPNYAAIDTDVVSISGEFTDFTYLMPKDDIVRGEAQFTPDGSHLVIDGSVLIAQVV